MRTTLLDMSIGLLAGVVLTLCARVVVHEIRYKPPESVFPYRCYNLDVLQDCAVYVRASTRPVVVRRDGKWVVAVYGRAAR